MTTRFYFRLVAFVFAAILCVAVIHAWRADRRDRAQLAAEFAATKQLLTAADARQRDRDSQLAQTLSALAAQKRGVITPAQIVQELQKSIPLPEPIILDQPSQASEPRRGTTHRAPPKADLSLAPDEASQANGDKPTTASGLAQTSAQPEAPRRALIPRADLRPLYDFTLDCQACQAKLSAAQIDLADERAKTTALTKERDAAVRIAKGGSALRRIACAAKWFVLGAAAGAIASKTAH